MRGRKKSVFMSVCVCVWRRAGGLKNVAKQQFGQIQKVLIMYCNTRQGGFDVWRKEAEADCDDG